MADCSKCKKKRAEAAPNVNLTENEKKIIYAMEMSGARQHQTMTMRSEKSSKSAST